MDSSKQPKESDAIAIPTNFGEQTLDSLMLLFDRAIDMGRDDLGTSIQDEIRRRTLPKAAKTAAAQIMIAGVHHDAFIGAHRKTRGFDWEFELAVPLWTPELELLRFALCDDYEDEMYEDVHLMECLTDMAYDVIDATFRDRDLLEKLQSGPKGATATFIFWACRYILGILEADDGEVFEKLSSHLIQNESITAEEVFKIIGEVRKVDKRKVSPN